MVTSLRVACGCSGVCCPRAQIKTNLSACPQPLGAALPRAGQRPLDRGSAGLLTPRGRSHRRGRASPHPDRVAPSAQTAPGAQDRCNKLTEAHISIFLWLWDERRWLPVKRLTTSQFPSTCWLPTQGIRRGLLRHWHSVLKSVGLESNPNLKLPFFSLVLLFGTSHNRPEPKLLRDLWKSCGDEMSVAQRFSKWGGPQ